MRDGQPNPRSVRESAYDALANSLRAIGPSAFGDTAIEILCVPDGIETVESKAFQSVCSLIVDWPNVDAMTKFHVASGANDWLIKGEKPSVIEIPGTVISVPERAFADASLMFTVTPPKGNQGFVKVQID